MNAKAKKLDSNNNVTEPQTTVTDEIAPAQFNISAQYLKDLSFENPNAPESLVGKTEQPKIAVQVNVGAQRLADDLFEVTLSINGEAKHDEAVAFIVEIEYAGIFTITNVPSEHLSAILLIECPRFLFPFARAIIAGATRDGGFPPLMIQPIDFVALYQANQPSGSGESA